MKQREDEIQAEPLYKWLTADGRTAVQHAPWPEAVGEWTKPEKPVLCKSGWHAMYERDVLTHLPSGTGAKLWRVEFRGEIVEGNDKIAAESMRLLYCLGETTEANLRLFACDVAQDALSLVESPDPRSLAAIKVARRFAVGNATRTELDAARDAARVAAWDAAGDAAWDAAWDAAGVAAGDARDAARDAARYAAGVAAGYAAGVAAWSAARARYSNWLVVRIESGYS